MPSVREAIKAREEELEIINRYTWDLYATDVAGFKLDTPIKVISLPKRKQLLR